MRTKTLLLTAALSVAGMVSAMAATSSNVYSVNVVGYVTKTIYPGFNLLANPLSATNTSLQALIPVAPENAQAFQLQGGVYQVDTFVEELGGWDGPPIDLALGTGVFIYNPAPAFNVTFVGEVQQGVISNSIPVGFSMQSSKVPQGTNVFALGLAGKENDQIFKYVNAGAGEGYQVYTFIEELGGWDGSPPVDPAAGPNLEVGEALLYSTSAGANPTWTRNFTVE
jgi:hypothetical protein